MGSAKKIKAELGISPLQPQPTITGASGANASEVMAMLHTQQQQLQLQQHQQKQQQQQQMQMQKKHQQMQQQQQHRPPLLLQQPLLQQPLLPPPLLPPPHSAPFCKSILAEPQIRSHIGIGPGGGIGGVGIGGVLGGGIGGGISGVGIGIGGVGIGGVGGGIGAGQWQTTTGDKTHTFSSGADPPPFTLPLVKIPEIAKSLTPSVASLSCLSSAAPTPSPTVAHTLESMMYSVRGP
jgi:hypothetical protein